VPTAERFRDPSSGVIMRVWIDPSDESRHYVPDDAPALLRVRGPPTPVASGWGAGSGRGCGRRSRTA
jgi:hypothetical protein